MRDLVNNNTVILLMRKFYKKEYIEINFITNRKESNKSDPIINTFLKYKIVRNKNMKYD